MRREVPLLPDPLKALDGRIIRTRESWETHRRPEILSLFREHVYGYGPEFDSASLTFRCTEKRLMAGDSTRIKPVEIQFEGAYGQGMMHLVLYLPRSAVTRLPLVLVISTNLPSSWNLADELHAPVSDMLARGYGVGVYFVEELDPDVDDGFHNGVHGLFDPKSRPRSPNAWGTIAAWAWGASRVMDYLQTDEDIDCTRVVLVGHSRLGKTALWAAANDSRFAMVASNQSGCTGAAVSRTKTGETVRDINQRFPHWFCQNYKQFNDREDSLPVDQHLLLSLIAPRLIYVTSASEDVWADPEAEFLSVTVQEPVYALYRLRGLGTSTPPYPNIPLVGERIGYHMRTGAHDFTVFDWRGILSFADTHLNAPIVP